MSGNVLILRALGLGDFLTGIPALRLIRLALPGDRLILAGPPHLGKIARHAGLVDDLLPTYGLQQLPETPDIDVAIDLHGNGTASRQILIAREPRRLVAFTVSGMADWTLPGVVERAPSPTPKWDGCEHEVHRWCRLIAES